MPADSAFGDLDGVKAIPLEGLNERIVPESIPIGDLSKLIGLRQNRLGELTRYPGEALIDISPIDSIRGLFTFGDYIIIQTGSSLLRTRINELFPEFPTTSPELFPDNYTPPGPTPPAINPELMSYALVNYQLPSGTDSGNVLAANFTSNVVPFNTVASDSTVGCSVAAGVITIQAAVYPAWVRLDGYVCVEGPASIAAGANSNQRLALRARNNTTPGTISTGVLMRETTANSANNGRPASTLHIKGRFVIVAATDIQFEVNATEASNYGRANGLGEPEVYAQMEILVEE